MISSIIFSLSIVSNPDSGLDCKIQNQDVREAMEIFSTELWDTQKRRNAYNTIETSGGKEAVSCLIKILFSSRPAWIRNDSSELLYRLAGNSVAKDFIRVVETDSAESVRLKVLSILSVMDDDCIDPLLARLANDSNLNIRLQAIAGLGTRRVEFSSSTLTEILTISDDETVKMAALNALSGIQSRHAIPLAMHLLARRASAQLRAHALRYISEVGIPSDLALLSESLKGISDYQIRILGSYVLRSIGEPHLPRLNWNSQSGSYWVSYLVDTALRGFGNSLDEDVIPFVVETLRKHQSSTTRTVAAQILTGLNKTEIIPDLERILGKAALWATQGIPMGETVEVKFALECLDRLNARESAPAIRRVLEVQYRETYELAEEILKRWGQVSTMH